MSEPAVPSLRWLKTPSTYGLSLWCISLVSTYQQPLVRCPCSLPQAIVPMAHVKGYVLWSQYCTLSTKRHVRKGLEGQVINHRTS